MTTSPPLQQTDLFGTVSASHGQSSVRRHVRTSAPPTSRVKASTVSAAGSTSKPSGLSTNADLVGSLLKTALISELAAQTGSSLSWKNSATPSGHSWFVLETSGPTTSGPEAGSSALMATPRKTDADRGGRGDVLSQLRGYPSRHAGMMPTPVKPNGGRTLTREAIETGKRANGQKAQIDTPNILRYALETLPTPTKRDSRMDKWSPAYDRRKSSTMDAVLDGAMTDRATAKWAGARALASLLQSHGLTGTAALPITYGWMMGFPPGWLARALQSAVHEGHLQQVSSSKRSATPSSRKSPKQ